MPHEGPPSGLNVWLVLVVASRLVQVPAEPPVRCCTRYRPAPVTALQEIVNVSPDRDTARPSGEGGVPSATFVTLISTVADDVPPAFPSRASTVSVYDDTVS